MSTLTIDVLADSLAKSIPLVAATGATQSEIGTIIFRFSLSIGRFPKAPLHIYGAFNHLWVS